MKYKKLAEEFIKENGDRIHCGLKCPPEHVFNAMEAFADYLEEAFKEDKCGLTSKEMDKHIERYNKAKKNGTLDRDFPTIDEYFRRRSKDKIELLNEKGGVTVRGWNEMCDKINELITKFNNL